MRRRSTWVLLGLALAWSATAAAAGEGPSGPVPVPSNIVFLWAESRQHMWTHANGISIWGRAEGILQMVPQDVRLSAALHHRAYFLATHGLPGETAFVNTAEALGRMQPRPGQSVIFNGTCWAGQGASGQPSLAWQQWKTFRMAAVGPNGVLTFSDVVNHQGRPTVFYWVKDGNRVLPKAEAFTHIARNGTAYQLRNAAEPLLNRGRSDIRFLYGRPPDAADAAGAAGATGAGRGGGNRFLQLLRSGPGRLGGGAGLGALAEAFLNPNATPASVGGSAVMGALYAAPYLGSALGMAQITDFVFTIWMNRDLAAGRAAWRQILAAPGTDAAANAANMLGHEVVMREALFGSGGAYFHYSARIPEDHGFFRAWWGMMRREYE